MRGKVVLPLSLFGAAMGAATVYVIPSYVEPWVWGGLVFVSAWVIAKYARGRYFLHGLLVGLLDAAWFTVAHIALLDRWVAGHAREVALIARFGEIRTAV